jgi:hypothetical protein
MRVDQGSIKVSGEDLVIGTRVSLDPGHVRIASNDLIVGLLDDVILHLTAAIYARRIDPGGSSWIEHLMRAVQPWTELRRVGRPAKKAGERRDEQVTAFVDDGHTVAEAAVLFDIAEATVVTYVGRVRRRCKS